jgi:hemolysin-activating ACP:hemolysin acyltransferase
LAAWADLSEAVEARLPEANPRLAPIEWKSGDRLWLINLFAPFGHTKAGSRRSREDNLCGKDLQDASHAVRPEQGGRAAA